MRCVNRLVNAVLGRLGSDPLSAVFLLDINIIATTAGNIAILGGRLRFEEDVEFLLQVGSCWHATGIFSIL